VLDIQAFMWYNVWNIYTTPLCSALSHPYIKNNTFDFFVIGISLSCNAQPTCILELLLIFTVLIVVCFIHNDYPPKRKKKKPHFHMFDFHIKDYAGGSDREKKN